MSEHPPPATQNILEDDAIEADVEPLEDRIALEGRGLREHTARGAVINSLFQIGLSAVGLLQRVIVAAFLTTSEYGIWGLLVTTLITLAWLKQIGIGDKFVQQDERDQEAAFQKAFTLHVAWSAIFFCVAALAMPLYGLLYGHAEIIVPGVVLSLTFITSAFQSPIWIAYRQMRFFRQRVLESVDPLIATTLTIGLAAGGLGYWALVIGPVVGSVCGAVAAVSTSPYRLGWRFERRALREYYSFSWPLLAASASGLVVVQGSILIGNYTVGLAGLGALGLASTFSMFADKLDTLIRRTIYPAVAAVKDRTPLLFETFTKSNRVALMWAFPFGVGLALFAPDLITYVLGEKWRIAEPLMQTFGLVIAFRQVAFNWVVFFSAVGNTRPMAVSGVAAVVVFATVTAPLMFWIGLDGYAIGMSAAVVVDLAIRGYYLRRLFSGFGIVGHMVRSVLPSVPPALVILALHVAGNWERTLGVAVAELALYLALTVASTFVFERRLIAEILGYMRRGISAAPATG